jgi:hypothetical protein
MRITVRVLSAVAILGTAVVPVRGVACGNSYYHEVNPQVRQLQAAESSLTANALAGAGKLALELYPQTRQKTTAADPLEQRARRVLALVSVRTGGKWVQKDVLVDPGEQQRSANLDWSTAVLRGRYEQNKDQPAPAVELAEALALRDNTRAEAEKYLEQFAAKDLIGNPYAWVTLARLRQARGDAVGRDRALAKCRPLANDQSVCTLTPPAAGAKKKA